MLAYYLEWHMRQRLAPMLFDDTDKETAEALRASVVAQAQRSPAAVRKQTTGDRGRDAGPQFPIAAGRFGDRRSQHHHHGNHAQLSAHHRHQANHHPAQGVPTPRRQL
jgi:hypothetical protein